MVGLGFAALHASYMLLRVDRATITSKPITLSPFSVLSTFIVIGCGALPFITARSCRGRLGGLLLAFAPQLAATVFTLGGVAALNSFVVRPALGTTLWNYAPGLQALRGLVIIGALVGLGFAFARRSWRVRWSGS